MVPVSNISYLHYIAFLILQLPNLDIIFLTRFSTRENTEFLTTGLDGIV